MRVQLAGYAKMFEYIFIHQNFIFHQSFIDTSSKVYAQLFNPILSEHLCNPTGFPKIMKKTPEQ